MPKIPWSNPADTKRNLTAHMITWLFLSGFVALSALWIVRPFLRREPRDATSVRFSTRVDELKTALVAVDRDEEAGLVTPSEAEQSRVRIAEDYEAYVAKGEADETGARSVNSYAPAAAYGAVFILGVIAFTSYALAGAPGYRDHPLEWRKQNDPIVELAHNVERMEAYLSENPDDANAWAMIGPIYFEYGNWSKAAHAYLSAARYGSFTDAQKSRLLVMATRSMLGEAEGVFTESSILVADASARYDPTNIQARFLQADATTQNAPVDEAIALWERFVVAFPEDETGFRETAEQRLATLRSQSGQEPQRSVRGPSEEQIEAAGDLSETDRARMIDGMIERLAMRLQENPSDAAGWEQLIRSYVVLERIKDAEAALARAQSSLKSDAEAFSRLQSVAEELSLEP